MHFTHVLHLYKYFKKGTLDAEPQKHFWLPDLHAAEKVPESHGQFRSALMRRRPLSLSLTAG